ncbi:MAG TPA: hypothetical protein DCX27_01135 [Balneola sp.]|nr:hypothetical protein [Balneola sp.]
MRFFFFLSFLFLSTGIYAQDSSTGFPMLESAPTPSGLAINDAGVAVPMGSASLYLNPALLVLNPASSIDLGYSSWIEDSNYLFGGANFLNGNRSFTLGIYSSKSGGFEQRNNPGGSNGEFSISHLSLSAGLAYKFNLLSLGVSGQFLNEENAQYQSSGYAFNFGAAATFIESRLKTGISILNIGKLDDLNNQPTELPELLRAGVSFKVLEFAHPKNPDLPFLVNIATDYVKPLNARESLGTGEQENDSYFNIGLFLTVAEVLEVSGGYKTGENTVKPFSFGVGFITELVTVNYALVPYETGFGTLHSIGLQYKF